ncbi:hypothetical protein D9613_010078 [Agrocybe pediades]|uniref:Uncharacterized protein n=1 Tax=Agrocybe pediades TaxID=84607 RepID=A0A8H4QXF7_9AGAR|nr:hypothetical protein D9613_010078 [Agrocybe pediades]
MAPTIPLDGPQSFNLDVSGIAGFFGGDESFAAMSSVHLVRGRRWMGWYNSPGSYIVAKKYGVLAKSRVWDGLFPGVNVDPTRMLELDGKVGPRYLGVHSGTSLDKTGHLAYLLAEHCSELPDNQIVGTASPTDLHLTIVHLNDYPEEIIRSDGTLPSVHLSPFDPIGIMPILVSIGAAVICGVFRDWWSFSMIVTGIIVNGISCAVIGSGVLKVKGPNPSKHSPPGDGIFFSTGSNQRVILLKGSERIVSTLVRGQYFLHYKSQSKYHDIGLCSMALTAQFLVQLFLMPQGRLFGQIMFLATFAVSWLYNAYLASVDREDLQKHILVSALLQKPKAWTIRVPKYTTLAVLAAMNLQTGDARPILDAFIPNNTKVWNLVKGTVAEGIKTNVDPAEIIGGKNTGDLTESESKLLHDMISLSSLAFQTAKETPTTLPDFDAKLQSDNGSHEKGEHVV